MPMEWTETERGGRKLLFDGYIYVKKRNLAAGWESFECNQRRNKKQCKASIKVRVSVENEFRDRTEHNHPPDHGKANAYKVKNAVKRMALETDESPKQILMATMQQATQEGLMAMPGLEHIRRSIRRQRQDSRQSMKVERAAEPGLSDIWSSIRKQQRDIQEALVDRRKDQEILEDNGLSSLPGKNDDAIEKPGCSIPNNALIPLKIDPETEGRRSSSPATEDDPQDALLEYLDDEQSTYPAGEHDESIAYQGSQHRKRHHQNIQHTSFNDSPKPSSLASSKYCVLLEQPCSKSAKMHHQDNPNEGSTGHRSSAVMTSDYAASSGSGSTDMQEQAIQDLLATDQDINSQGSSFPAAEVHDPLPDLGVLKEEHEDIQRAFGIQWEC
nr:uncharacterized protein LOC129277627 [Lytechinus pictus]